MQPDPLPPGEFVNAELQSECARFLDQVKDLVRRRDAFAAGEQV